MKTVKFLSYFIISIELFVTGFAYSSNPVCRDGWCEDLARQQTDECYDEQSVQLRATRNTSSGVYFLEDIRGNRLAIFKPESERNWGPENPNPARRKKNFSMEDVHFHQLSSFEQGHSAARQHLAYELDFGEVAQVPNGKIVEMDSDQFVDLKAEKSGGPPRWQRKRGYLQTWVHDTTPLADYLGSRKKQFALSEHPVLNEVPLEEYQKIAILDVLLFNEDRHLGNVLVKDDAEGRPHLIPIDMDAILPIKLNGNMLWLRHSRAEEPLCEKAVGWIRSFDPLAMEAKARALGLHHEVAQNLRVTAMLLQIAADEQLTLSQVGMIVNGGSDNSDSPLWTAVVQAQEYAKQDLTQPQKDQHSYYSHLRWKRWWPEASLSAEEMFWWKEYTQNLQHEIEEKLQLAFWTHLDDGLRGLVSTNKNP